MKGYVIVRPYFSDGGYTMNETSDEQRLASAASACERIGAGNYWLLHFSDDGNAQMVGEIEVALTSKATCG